MSVQIIDFNNELKMHFERLNRLWIEKFFSIEPHDIRLFGNPEAEIIATGGDIIFAKHNAEIIGTCALTFNKGLYELAKLSVSENARGLGAGELLCEEILRRAKKKGADKIQLTTNTCLVPAVELYKKLGFVEIFRGQHPEYKRVNLVMEKQL